MDRRKFVAKATVLTFGLSTSAFALARGTTSLSLNAEEQEMLNEFRQILAGYSHSTGVAHQLTAVRKINDSADGVLDFIDAAGNRTSLRRTRGRLVARLHLPSAVTKA